MQIKGRIIRVEQMRLDMGPRRGHPCHPDIVTIDDGIVGPLCADRLEVLDQLIVGVHPIYEDEVVLVKPTRPWKILRRESFRELYTREEAPCDLARQFRSDPILATLHLRVNDVNKTAGAKSRNYERREAERIAYYQCPPPRRGPRNPLK